MVVKDDRTPKAKKIPHVIILATDPFMSGWGGAEGGVSFAGWAAPEGYANAVESRIRQRGDMKRVRVVRSDYRPSSSTRGYCHIYLSEEFKAILKGWNPQVEPLSSFDQTARTA